VAATIKPTATVPLKGGRLMTMQGDHWFVAQNLSTRELIEAAYDLPPALVAGGSAWVQTERFDIQGQVPGEVKIC
jgi:uncharacterized protein (TIGR03435 family)